MLRQQLDDPNDNNNVVGPNASGETNTSAEVDTTNEKADTLTAEELAALTATDRERIFHDIHGVSDRVNETDQMIQESLHQMKKELSTLASTHNAYQRALEQNPSYVNDPAFRLRFLRADRFNVSQATHRYFLHYEKKLELFGEDRLTHHLTQKDLNKDDLDALYNTMGYTLPDRDPAGRLILVMDARNSKFSNSSLLRKTFYALMVGSEDEETQKKGCISIAYLLGHDPLENSSKRRELNRQWSSILSSTPMRLEAIHICIDNYFWRPFVALFRLTASMFTRLRVREHYGDAPTVLFSLQTFGIPMQNFPFEIVKGTNASNGKFWSKRLGVEQQRQKSVVEQETKVCSDGTPSNPGADVVVVETPNNHDVLLGRGKATYSHVGNIRFRNLIFQYGDVYEAATQKQKTKVAEDIMQIVHSRNGRFLREGDLGWVKVDKAAARRKVAHAFRTLRSLLAPIPQVAVSLGGNHESNQGDGGNQTNDVRKRPFDQGV
eukprot:Nitzschia sp. Nitz4//scaffold72_size95085//12875//14353//NITZ4_004745-RA/size95085-processed-gene-0.79-mRNA-1//1//CDS//3329557330//1596//frame0